MESSAPKMKKDPTPGPLPKQNLPPPLKAGSALQLYLAREAPWCQQFHCFRRDPQPASDLKVLAHRARAAILGGHEGISGLNPDSGKKV